MISFRYDFDNESAYIDAHFNNISRFLNHEFIVVH